MFFALIFFFLSLTRRTTSRLRRRICTRQSDWNILVCASRIPSAAKVLDFYVSRYVRPIQFHGGIFSPNCRLNITVMYLRFNFRQKFACEKDLRITSAMKSSTILAKNYHREIGAQFLFQIRTVIICIATFFRTFKRIKWASRTNFREISRVGVTC